MVVFISSREASAYGPRLTRSSAKGFISKSSLSGKALASLLAERAHATVGPPVLAGWCRPGSGRGVGGVQVGRSVVMAARPRGGLDLHRVRARRETLRPDNNGGTLMAATGFTWFLGNFAGANVDLVAGVGRTRPTSTAASSCISSSRTPSAACSGATNESPRRSLRGRIPHAGLVERHPGHRLRDPAACRTDHRLSATHWTSPTGTPVLATRRGGGQLDHHRHCGRELDRWSGSRPSGTARLQVALVVICGTMLTWLLTAPWDQLQSRSRRRTRREGRRTIRGGSPGRSQTLHWRWGTGTAPQESSSMPEDERCPSPMKAPNVV